MTPSPIRFASFSGPHGGHGGVVLPAGFGTALRLAAPVLVVEDEAVIAMDLARQIADDGGTVVGPADSVDAALALLAAASEVGGAVLDVHLGRETAYPVAAALALRGVPFVFYTAYDEPPPPAFAHAPVLAKTDDWPAIKRALLGRSTGLRDEVAALLPELRQTARRLAHDPEAADRLVERTLERAADEVAARRFYGSVGDWLTHLMKRVAQGHGRPFH